MISEATTPTLMPASRKCSTQADVVRNLGALERWFYLMDQNHSNHFSITAAVSGPTTPAMWREALHQLQWCHPLLNVSIAEREHAQICFVRDGDRSIPLKVLRRTSPRQWQEIAVEDLSVPFDTARSPLIRATLLHSDTRCEMMLSVHHSIADGMSVAFLMRDLVSAVAGNALAPHPVPASQGVRFAELRARPLPRPMSASASRPTGFQPVELSHPRIDAIQITQEETEALIDAARREGTTLHAGIAAAAVIAGRTITPAWKQRSVRFCSAISLRNLLDVRDNCVVALSAGIANVDPQPDEDLWELARTIKQKLMPQQSRHGVASVLAFFDMVTANGTTSAAIASLAAESLGFEFMLTNLGRVPFDAHVGNLRIEALWGPVIHQGYEEEQTISAATVDGSLCLVHTSTSPIPSLLTTSMKMLRNAAGFVPRKAPAETVDLQPVSQA